MKQYLKGFFSFSIGTWIRAVVSFLSTPIISYLIIPEEFGRASMFTLAYNIALLISLMGLDQSFIRYYYEEQNKSKIFWNCLIPSTVFGIIISLISLFLEKSLSILLFGNYYKWIGVFFAFSLLTGIIQRFNQLSIRMQKKGFLFSLINIVSSLANFGGTVFYALTISRNFYALVFGQITGNITALSVGFFADKQYRRLTKLNLRKLKDLLKYGLPFIPSSLLFWLFSSIDRISLKQFSTFTEIGLYSAAFKIVSVMQLVQAGFSIFWISIAYEKYESDNNSKKFFEKASSIISAVLFIFGLLVLTFKDLIFLLFSKSYRDASYIAPFLILNPIMNIMSDATSLGINFSKKTYWHIVITGISAFVNFAGNTLLVPLLGAKGAAVSTGISYILLFTFRSIVSQKYFPLRINFKKIYISTFLTIIVASVGTFIKLHILYFGICILALFSMLLLYRDTLFYLKKQLKN